MSRVSVVIPSYNHAAFIGDAVASVLDQTWNNFELIIVDDGSKDDTLRILGQFDDPRIRVFAQDNRGAHAAINHGLKVADGEYLAILNSDDMYKPDRIERLIEFLERRDNIGLVGSYIEVIDDLGKSLAVKQSYHSLEPWPLEFPERSFRAEQNRRAALYTENFFATTSNFLFRRELWEKVGRFSPLRYTHDWDFALRAARVAELHVIPEPLMRYRVHAENTIRKDRAALIYEICWILAVHLPFGTKEVWFENRSLSIRVDQLLHSIFTYGFSQVLAVMLLQEISKDRPVALKLLESGNSVRTKYIDYILERLDPLENGIQS